jgi:hypothetical protein
MPSLVDVLRQDQLRVDDIQTRLSDDVRGSQAPGGPAPSDSVDMYTGSNEQPTADVSFPNGGRGV